MRKVLLLAACLGVTGCDFRPNPDRFTISETPAGVAILKDGETGDTWVMNADGGTIYWQPVEKRQPPTVNLVPDKRR